MEKDERLARWAEIATCKQTLFAYISQLQHLQNQRLTMFDKLEPTNDVRLR